MQDRYDRRDFHGAGTLAMALGAAAVAVILLVAAAIVQARQTSVGLQTWLALTALFALAIAGAAILLERLNARRAAAVQRRMTDDLRAARQAAEEADAAKTRFLAAASHDMRQPLHALALYISSLQRRVESEQGRLILANMDEAVQSMTRLFTALLDLARLEAGVLTPDPIVFDVHELLQDIAAQSVDPRAGKARVRVVETSLQMLSDPDLLEIALRNLVSNAIKHSKGGRVLLGCRRIGGEVRIEVHDDGEGIPEDQLGRLFAEFVRGEGAGSTDGIGLGLSIVDRMAKLLGHELSVRSRVGRGTVFAIAGPRAERPRPEAPAETRAATLDGVRVLLADDDPLSLDAMRHTLEDAGAQVTTAQSAPAARKRDDASVDLYIVDLNLGRDNGLRLLDELDRRRGGPAPALVVTGATQPETLAELRRSGRSWLTKPVTVADLTAAAAEALSGEGPRRAG